MDIDQIKGKGLKRALELIGAIEITLNVYEEALNTVRREVSASSQERKRLETHAQAVGTANDILRAEQLRFRGIIAETYPNMDAEELEFELQLSEAGAA